MALQQPIASRQILRIVAFANYGFKPLEPNPVRLYLAQLSSNGRDTMERALFRTLQIINPPHLDEYIQKLKHSRIRKIDAIFDFDWTKLTYRDLMQVRAGLLENFSRKTTDQALNAVRRVLEEAFRAGHISMDTFERTTDLPHLVIHDTPSPSGRAVTMSEVQTLLQSCIESNDHNARDGALIALLASLGLRSCEIRRLRLADYDTNGRQLLINGKGNKQRTLPISDGAAHWLHRWLEVRGVEPGALFFTNDKQGHLINRFMSRSLLFNIVRNRSTQAGVRIVSPHDFRRGFITDMLQTEHLLTVTFMAGHSSPNTTRRYDHRSIETLKHAVSLLDIDVEL